ncbi:MAG: NADH-quinone oxidoreductase subunit C [Thermodesulfobacteriota bacterium]
MERSDIPGRIKRIFPSLEIGEKKSLGQLHLYPEMDLENLPEVMNFLREDSQLLYKMLTDITAVDLYDSEPRFELIYFLFSLEFNHRLYVHIKVRSEEYVPSLSDVWASANWAEREVYDLMGIQFQGHPDLRRILTWDNFTGHPLRKDFPLGGWQSPDRFDPDSVRVDSAFTDSNSNE